MLTNTKSEIVRKVRLCEKLIFAEMVIQLLIRLTRGWPLGEVISIQMAADTCFIAHAN